MSAYSTSLGISELDEFQSGATLDWAGDLFEVYNLDAELGRRNQSITMDQVFKDLMTLSDAGHVVLLGGDTVRLDANNRSASLVGGDSKTNAAHVEVFGDAHATTPGQVEARIKGTGSFKVTKASFGLTTPTTLVAVNSSGTVALTQGTITAAAPSIDASSTWNNGAVVFAGWKLNVTDTASDAASLLLDLQVGGVSKFSVDKSGNVTGNITINNDRLVLTQGTITDPATMIDGTVTWNDAADTFTAWKLNVTDTASAAASMLLDLQLGGTSVMNLRKDGRLTLAGRAAFNTTSSLGHSFSVTDANNATAVVVNTFGHALSSGTAAAGMGSHFDWTLDSTTTSLTRAARWSTTWTDATHATRSASTTFNVFVSGSETPQLIVGGNQIAGPVGTALLPSWVNRNDTITGSWYPATSTMAWSLAAAEAMRLNTTGLGIHITPITDLTVASISASDPRGIMTAQYSADAVGARLHFRKSRGATAGTDTVVQSGDILGRIRFSGCETGGTYIQMASIDVGTSGTIGTNRVPTYMTFSTATDAATSVLTEAIRIDNAGNVGIGTVGPMRSKLYVFDVNAYVLIGRPSSGYGGVTFTSGGGVTNTLATASVYGNGVDTMIGAPTGGTVYLRINNVTRASTNSSGFGVGPSSAPSANLDVNNSITATTSHFYDTTDGAASPTNYSRFAINTAASGSNYTLRTEAGGTGLTAGQPRTLQIGTGPCAGTNIAGKNAIAHAGQGTGSATGGNYIIQTATLGSSGIDVNPLVDRVTVTGGGNVGIGTSPSFGMDIMKTTKLGSQALGQRVMISSQATPFFGSAIYQESDRGATQGSTRILSTALGSLGTNAKSNLAFQYSTDAQAYGGDPSSLTYATAMVVDGNAGFVGIGITAPATELNVASISASDPRGIMTAQYSADAIGARLHFRKSRGAAAGTDTIVQSGDILGRIRFSGYDSAAYLQMASIDVGTSGTIGTNRVPTYMTFSTATDAATSVLTEALRINSAQVAIFNAQVRLKGYTVAGLPAGTQGDSAFVTDALAPTFLVAVAGGGAVVTPVFYNGSAWVAG